MRAKILQVIGCRPHVIKLIDMADAFEQRLLWTGQHYTPELAKDILDEFGIVLDSAYKCTELWRMVSVIEEYIKDWKPDCVVVYGDTRTSMAGAIAALDAKVKLAHVEAGVRLHNATRYEDKVRRAIDHMSDYLFAPTEEACRVLADERVPGEAYWVGDILYERYLKSRKHNGFAILTLHRQETVDDKQEFQRVLEELNRFERVVFPAHPRALKRITEFKLKLPKNILIVPPMSYSVLQSRIKVAEAVVTDSGGVIREATYAGTPVCVVGNTEWAGEIYRFGMGDTSKLVKKVLQKCLT